VTEKGLVPAPAQGGALTVGGAVEFNLDAFPTKEYNRLVPTQSVITTDLLMPMVQVVQLEPADAKGASPDHYSSADVPAGHRAPTARGLRKLASTAGVSFYDERRLDDGSDPNICGVSVMASMLLPTGQRITAPGSQMIDIRTWFKGDASTAEVAKFRKQFYAHVATRAYSRAIRGLLSLRAIYPIADINKPFAIVTYVPNTRHPDVRAAMLQGMAGSIPALYGPEPARQIAAGETIQAPEAPEDDEPTEGSFTDAEAEPDWLAGTTAEKPVSPSFTEQLRSLAAASKRTGGAVKADIEALTPILVPLGTEPIRWVMQHLWGHQEPEGKVLFSAAQAEAIVTLANSMGVEAFQATWRALDAELQKAAPR
jgi:hypothetical protein